MSQVRKFKSGATRDTEKGKIDLEGFMSPMVLKAFGEYMSKHRLQADGKLRESDNWQKGFGDKPFDVCMKSGFRHFHDWWLSHRGYESRNGIEDAMAGLMFNIMAYWHEYLKQKLKTTTKKQKKYPKIHV